jgi:ketosteroid isomerase-like protein
MSNEFTPADPVELVRKQVEALNRADLDGVMSNVTEDVVLDGRVEVVEGRTAIRGFLGDWFGAYKELDFELEEVSHLGGGVVFAVMLQDGHLLGGGHLQQREGWVYLCTGGSIARLTTRDVHEARAAAETARPGAELTKSVATASAKQEPIERHEGGRKLAAEVGGDWETGAGLRLRKDQDRSGRDGRRATISSASPWPIASSNTSASSA